MLTEPPLLTTAPPPPSLTDPILIIGGAGTFGLSTAWHLAQRGYANITCLDRFPFPSKDSAGYDCNKMARSEYNPDSTTKPDQVIHRLSQEALKAWRENHLLRGTFHETGRISIASSTENYEELREYYTELQAGPRAKDVKWFDSPAELKQFAPYLTGELANAKAVFNPEGGWVYAKEAMQRVGEECKRLGVKFVSGGAGTVREFIFASSQIDNDDDDDKTSPPNSSRIIGVRCQDGTTHPAAHTILAAGAWSPTLLSLQSQLISKCWTLAHIPITNPTERALLKDIPVILDLEKGFFFEPETATGLVKICNEFPGFTRWVDDMSVPDAAGVLHKQRISVPRGHGSHPTDGIPTRSTQEIHDLLRLLKPEWADPETYPLQDVKMCWCTDTPDREFLVCSHPHISSLTLATGASGHGFKMLPTIGDYVADLVEGRRLEAALESAWRWRPDAGERPGDGTRPGAGGDLGDVGGWRRGEDERARG
ncbi:oxygen oxidoreductase [Fimicolochytrium jonesii]|uniref:oxygen oxidoreductase n=1 Tax=Fimicolochytrium jonesii TaxID=1396493 RepID=UPI0022FDD769|nr:oxygen oxidoreductase [Fimicolochytrium jonesii]KAI8819995.1 oxygen oxidoreductase [Fimicolochytrium jonesii]